MTRLSLAIVSLASIAILLAPASSDACSLVQYPFGAQNLAAGAGIPVHPDPGVAAGSDTQAPSAVTISDPRVTIVENGCDGSGASCPSLDKVQFNVDFSDDVTPAEKMRFIASFGETAVEATAAEPSVIFSADPSDVRVVRAWLGFNRARSGSGFDREHLCFTLSAVDAAGNVGPRSQPLCLETTNDSASYVTVEQGTTCTKFEDPYAFGCSSAGGVFPLALGAALGALLLRRKSRQATRLMRVPIPEISMRT